MVKASASASSCATATTPPRSMGRRRTFCAGRESGSATIALSTSRLGGRAAQPRRCTSGAAASRTVGRLGRAHDPPRTAYDLAIKSS